MRRNQVWIGELLLMVCALPVIAQQSSQLIVPPMVNFSGTLSDVNGKPLTGLLGVTFFLYKDQQSGPPLWVETQNVEADRTGRYSVMLGSATSHGLPADLFASGEARWLGVQVQGQEEQPRVMLLSVPYAMKAGDAQTVGGLPPSAFVLAASPIANAVSATGSSETASVTPATSSDVTTAGGTVDIVPLFTTATNIQNSLLSQTGTTAINVGGKLNLPALGTATASAGFNSQAQGFLASAYNSTSKAAVPQTFRLQAEPAGNDTATPSGTLNLLFASGTATPAETGLKISNKGLITFATGQTFPGTGTGTITGIKAGTDLTGGGSSGNVTLNVDTTKVPQLNTANTFTGNQTVNGNLSATGVVTGSSYQIGSNLFAFGSAASVNAFLGFAGNSKITGGGNTATGGNALNLNTSGGGNTANGAASLFDNSTGNNNTANGNSALFDNTTGSGNTASGYSSGNTYDNSVVTGSNDTFVGSFSAMSTGSLNNATAIGANAEVAASNALVLGSINGVNNATASTNVGIGTTKPVTTLDVHGNVSTNSTFGFSNVQVATSPFGVYMSAPASETLGFFTNGMQQMTINGTGYVGIGVSAPSHLLQMSDGAYESGGVWTNASDRNLKEGFAPVDGSSLLAKLNAVPMQSWKYKTDRSGIRHLGPMAQDFRAAFGLGEDDKHISTIDEGGLALAAIQELYREDLKKDATIRHLQAQIKEQRAKGRLQDAQIAALTSQMKAIQAALKTNGHTGSEVRTVKAQVPIVQH
jgi:trimeric autotransporter adhesin